MATITIKIDDATYENAKALYNFLGTDIETALKDQIKHAAYDEYPRYEHLKFNDETLAAMQECEDVLSDDDKNNAEN